MPWLADNPGSVVDFHPCSESAIRGCLVRSEARLGESPKRERRSARRFEERVLAIGSLVQCDSIANVGEWSMQSAMMEASTYYTDGGYEHAAPTWHAEDAPWKVEQIMRVATLPSLDRPMRICDIGCGVGGVTLALRAELELRSVRAEFVGYDIAQYAIDVALEKAEGLSNVSFHCVDVMSLDHLDFDLCLLVDVLEHLNDPYTFLSALRKRGIRNCIVHLPLESNWLAIMRGKTDPTKSDVGHLHFFDTHSALGFLARAGLTVTSWVYTPEIELDIRLHRTIGNMLAYVPRKLMFRLWPSLCVHTIGGAALMASCRFGAS